MKLDHIDPARPAATGTAANDTIYGTTGKDVINGLKEKVKNRLISAIHKPIQAKCRKFVSDGRDIGAGQGGLDDMHRVAERGREHLGVVALHSI